MKPFSSYIGKMINFLGAIFMSLLALTTFFQVINRFILRYPYSWTEELSRFLFIWVTLIGTVICVRDDTHIQIDLLYNKLAPKIQRIVSLIINIIFLTIAIIIFWQGIEILQFIKFQKAASLKLSMIWIYISSPICFLFIIFYLVLRIKKS